MYDRETELVAHSRPGRYDSTAAAAPAAAAPAAAARLSIFTTLHPGNSHMPNVHWG